MFRNTPHDHHIRQGADQFSARPASFATNRQALPDMFVDQVQSPRRAPVLRFRAHEVVAPHMVLALRPKPNARSIVEPQPSTRLLLLRNRQPFATPDALDSILANMPVRSPQQRRDAPVTVASVLTGQLNDGLRESILVFALCRLIPLRAAWLVHQLARTSFTHPMLARMCNRTAPSLRA